MLAAIENQAPQKKIYGLVCGRNEARYIEYCMKALSLYTDGIVYLDDASEDNTIEIIEKISKECKIIKIIKKQVWSRNETQDRNTILAAGRQLGGTHFIFLDADEMFTAPCMKNDYLRKEILQLLPCEVITLPLLPLRYSPKIRLKAPGWYLPCIFCDDGRSWYQGGVLHTPRNPFVSSNTISKTIKLELPFAVLHFAWVNTRDVYLKHAWYRCIERIINKKSIEEVNKLYDVTGTDNIRNDIEKIPDEWYYDFIDLSVYAQKDTTRQNQILKWINEYGSDYFKGLILWQDKWDYKESTEIRCL